MKTCKYCNKEVSDSHYCSAAGRTIHLSDDGDFLTSAVIGYATDNALIGGLLGGDLLGGIVGSVLKDGDLF